MTYSNDESKLDFESLRKFSERAVDIPHRISCGTDMLHAFRGEAIYTNYTHTSPSNVIFGLPVVVCEYFPRGVWCEHYTDRDIYHLPDGSTSEVPRADLRSPNVKI